MTVKTLTLSDGRTFKLGRKTPEIIIPHLELKNYLLANALPVAPSSIDYSIGSSIPLGYIYMNDTLGDCVCACIEHAFGVWESDAEDNNTSSNAAPLIYTNTQTVALYSDACGYEGTPQTDQGCDIQTTIKYVEAHGAPVGSNNKIIGYLSIDPANTVEQQLALYLFENLVFGCDMPTAWVEPLPQSNGFTWGVAGSTNNENGHCFLGVGYNSNGIDIATWGMLGTITYSAVSEYMSNKVYGELYTMISSEQLNTASQLAPNGLNWDQLVADFSALGGTVSNTTPVPVPNTAPNTTPTPVPNTTPTPVPNTTPTPVPNTAPNTTPVPGSAQWYYNNLSPTNYQELVNVYKAVEVYNPEVHLVSSCGWLKVNLSNTAWNELYTSITAL